MIRLFDREETDFSTDGVEVLDDIAISSVTNWKENSMWILEAVFKRDFDKSESIDKGMKIKVPTEKGDQIFSILKVNKKNRKFVSVSGHALGFDFNKNFIQDINIVNKSGRAAIKQISGGVEYTHKFNLSSNIDTVASARMVRKNGIDSLLGSKENTFVNRWGGFLVLNNFNIAMNTSVGVDNGVEIAVGKNVIDYDGTIDESSVVTGINAIGFDGLTLPEGIIYSPIKDSYGDPIIREIEFPHIKVKTLKPGDEGYEEEDGYATLAECHVAMRKECNDLFEIHNIDKPTCSLRINIAALEQTDQYKGDELNERIFQGDILTANLDDYGLDVKLKMVANRYDNIRDKYIDFDLGDSKANIFSFINNIQDKVDKVVEQLGGNSWQDLLNKSLEEATQLINEGIKDSYVIARKNEILIMDSIKVESAINVIRINKNGIAFSQSGYNGPYTLAITIDGKINASCITTGELNAALIKTGILMSSNGKTWIDMESGHFNFADKITYDGKKFKVDFSDTGAYNILQNASLKKGTKNFARVSTGTGAVGTIVFNIRNDNWSGNVPCLNLQVMGNQTGGETGFYQDITTEVGKKYIFTCYLAGHRSNKNIIIRGTTASAGAWVTNKNYGAINGGPNLEEWEKVAIPFTAERTTTRVELTINSTIGNEGYIWAKEPMVTEGEVWKPFTPTANEIANSNATIDNDGVEIRNGRLKVINASGEAVIDASKYTQYVAKYGNGSIVIANGAADKQVSIAHNLGFAPDYHVEFLDLDGNVLPNPHVAVDWNTGTITRQGWTAANPTHLHLWIRRRGSTSGTMTMYFRYFIYGRANL